jgi:hypothetical protein
MTEAMRLKVNGKAKLEVIREMLGKGANLGVEAERRMPTYGRNQPSYWYWRKALYRAGWPAEMCKSDWNSAYK